MVIIGSCLGASCFAERRLSQEEVFNLHVRASSLKGLKIDHEMVNDLIATLRDSGDLAEKKVIAKMVLFQGTESQKIDVIEYMMASKRLVLIDAVWSEVDSSSRLRLSQLWDAFLYARRQDNYGLSCRQITDITKKKSKGLRKAAVMHGWRWDRITEECVELFKEYSLKNSVDPRWLSRGSD